MITAGLRFISLWLFASVLPTSMIAIRNTPVDSDEYKYIWINITMFVIALVSRLFGLFMMCFLKFKMDQVYKRHYCVSLDNDDLEN